MSAPVAHVGLKCARAMSRLLRGHPTRPKSGTGAAMSESFAHFLFWVGGFLTGLGVGLAL